MEQSSMSQARPMMTIQESVRVCIRKYADFSGRATRAEYWWWVLATLIVSFALGAIDGFVNSISGYRAFSPFSVVFGIAILLPDLAVTCRRLHDIGRTGWWQLVWLAIGVLGAIPLIVGVVVFVISGFASTADDWGFSDWQVDSTGIVALVIGILVSLLTWLAITIWWIIWMVRQGQLGANRFGPDPRSWDGEAGVQQADL